MITSSSNHIIKYGKENDVRKFIPPVQTSVRPPEQETPAAEAGKEHQYFLGEPETMAVREAGRIIENAKEEARQILMKANDVAGNILKEARKQAEELRKSAIEEGYGSGLEQGIREGIKRADEEHGECLRELQAEFRADMEKALDSVEEAKERCLRTYLGELKDCSVAVAEKVIHISLKSSGEIIKRMIIAETEKLKKTAWVKIYMEKSDYDMMLNADADVISELTKLSDNIKFVVMEKEERGNCIIEMPDEIVDIGVDTQLENIREILGNIRI